MFEFIIAVCTFLGGLATIGAILCYEVDKPFWACITSFFSIVISVILSFMWMVSLKMPFMGPSKFQVTLTGAEYYIAVFGSIAFMIYGSLVVIHMVRLRYGKKNRKPITPVVMTA